MLTEHGERVSIAVVEDGKPERRLDMIFGRRAEAEATLKRLDKPGLSSPGGKTLTKGDQHDRRRVRRGC
jgi:hypothetical protein